MYACMDVGLQVQYNRPSSLCQYMRDDPWYTGSAKQWQCRGIDTHKKVIYSAVELDPAVVQWSMYHRKSSGISVCK